MDSRAKNELSSIRVEFNSIIREIESIQSGIQKDFIGIGNDICSNRLSDVLNSLYNARRALNSIDTTKVKEEYRINGGNRF